MLSAHTHTEMAARRYQKGGMAPEQPYAKVGAQVFNARVDYIGINSQLNSSSKHFYASAPRGVPAGEYKASKLMAYPPATQKQFEITNGQIVYRPNDRYPKGITKGLPVRQAVVPKDPSDVSIPVRSVLAPMVRFDDSDGFDTDPERQEAEALRLEKTIDIMGVANSPSSPDDNTGRFTVDSNVNRTVINNGTKPIPAGALVAARIPRPHELTTGPLNERENDPLPLLWTVPVDPRTWDLNQRAHFVQRVMVHFGAGTGPKGALKIGEAVLKAIAADAAAGKSHDDQVATGENILREFAMTADPFDVPVVVLMLAFLGYTQFVAAAGGAAPGPREAMNVTAVTAGLAFDAIARGPLWALRELMHAHDHLIFGRALSAALPNQEFLMHVKTF